MMMSNVEVAAERYAQEQCRKYVEKRGGSVPAKAAMDIFHWAFKRFMDNPEVAERAS